MTPHAFLFALVLAAGDAPHGASAAGPGCCAPGDLVCAMRLAAPRKAQPAPVAPKAAQPRADAWLVVARRWVGLWLGPLGLGPRSSRP